MAASTAGAAAGTSSPGGPGSGGPFGNIRKIIEDFKAKKAAEAGGNAILGSGGHGDRVKTNAAADIMAEGGGSVQPHGDEAHTGGGNTVVEPRKIGRRLSGNRAVLGLGGGGPGGLFYKMPASGAKYGNSPINKNYGDAKARGFTPPTKMNTFGVGDSNKEKMSGVGSDLLDK